MRREFVIVFFIIKEEKKVYDCFLCYVDVNSNLDLT